MYDNLSKAKDRAIPSKEILFKPKRWVTPLSVGLHVGWCLFLDSFAFSSWEPGWYLWWLYKTWFSSFLHFFISSFCSYAVSFFPHLFVFLPDRSVYWLGRNVRLRCGFIQNVQTSANLSSFQMYFLLMFSCNDSKNNHQRQKKVFFYLQNGCRGEEEERAREEKGGVSQQQTANGAVQKGNLHNFSLSEHK